jgi:Tol biopolymer transport system component
MDADGHHQTRLSTIVGAASPAWSPDGQYLAFNTETGLVVVGADGSAEHRLPILAMMFVWAPQ